MFFCLEEEKERQKRWGVKKTQTGTTPRRNHRQDVDKETNHYFFISLINLKQPKLIKNKK
jgi:hypothetical protein